MRNNMHDEILQGHRYGKKLTNKDYGTIAFLIDKRDIKRDKKENAKSFSNPELYHNCIYFLIGYESDNNDNSIEKMYVGKAGIRDTGVSVLDRLNEHAFLGTDPEKYIDKWTDIVVVTNRDKDAWGSTELDALEYIFWSLIPVGNRYNSRKPSSNGANLEKFSDAVNQIKVYLDYLGYEMFKSKTAEKLAEDVKAVAEAKSDLPVDLDNGTTKIPNITTPSKVVNKMLDMLPNDVWNSKTVFLDPACKGGEYLEAIYKRLVTNPRILAEFSNDVNRLSIHILQNQLFGIALTHNSRNVAVNKLGGFKYNIRVIPGYIDKLKKAIINCKPDKEQESIIDIFNKEFGEEMKFDVIIGNPPYQQDTEGGGSKTRGLPLYDKFILSAQVLAPTVSLITPVRWYNQPDKSFDKVRETMLNGQLEQIVDFADATKCFPENVSIAGGVSYWLWRKDRKGTTHIVSDDSEWDIDLTFQKIFIRDKVACSIVNKIDYSGIKTFDKIVSGTDMFGVLRKPLGIPQPDAEHPVKLKHSSNFNRKYNRGTEEYIAKSEITKNSNYVETYKVYTEYMNGSGNTVLNSIEILEPNEIVY